MKKCSQLSILLLLFAIVPSVPAGEQSVPSPRTIIMRATEQLVDALQANREAIKQDRAIAQRIADEVAIPLIDFPGAARSVLGNHWRSASQEQRIRFTRAFRRMLESVYITAMILYADEIISAARNISYPPLQMLEESEEALVRTLINLRGGMKAEVDYRMHRVDGSWKVHDVSVLGISLAKIYRSTFAREIRRRGLDGLIVQLENRHGPVPAASSGG